MKTVKTNLVFDSPYGPLVATDVMVRIDGKQAFLEEAAALKHRTKVVVLALQPGLEVTELMTAVEQVRHFQEN